MRVPSWRFERQYAAAGASVIAGVDEVGVGALAGPVVAGAVIFDPAKIPPSPPLSPLRPRASRGAARGALRLDKGGLGGIVLRDSKQLTARQRERAAAWIKRHAAAWAVGEASVAEITELNILQAAHLAMRRAVERLQIAPQLLLVDGRAMPEITGVPAVPIIDGDQLCCSIAAASIVAKVHRDALMAALDAQYPGYGFAAHKGYGSAAHLTALRTLGPCLVHRPTYAPVRAVCLTAA